jgi:hypothetical protein
MVANNAHHWSELSPESLSLEAIKKLHAPPSHYRISPRRYEAGTTFPGTSRAGRLYVLAGACTMQVGEWRASLLAGMFADFPAGHFEFKVLGNLAVSLVDVWLIPEQYRANSNA